MPAIKTTRRESIINALTYHKTMGRITGFWEPGGGTTKWCVYGEGGKLLWFTTPQALAFCEGLAIMEKHYNRKESNAQNHS